MSLKKCMSLVLSVQSILCASGEFSKEQCVSTMRRIVACRVGSSSLDECRGCMTEKELLEKALSPALFASKAELSQAALAQSIEKKDDAIVSLALKHPYDSDVLNKCRIRATQRLVQAKECELFKDDQKCQGVSSVQEVLDQCEPYFESSLFGYNRYYQLDQAKKLASQQNKNELTLALKEDANSAYWKAWGKKYGVPIGICVLLAMVAAYSELKAGADD